MPATRARATSGREASADNDRGSPRVQRRVGRRAAHAAQHDEMAGAGEGDAAAAGQAEDDDEEDGQPAVRRPRLHASQEEDPTQRATRKPKLEKSTAAAAASPKGAAIGAQGRDGGRGQRATSDSGDDENDGDEGQDALERALENAKREQPLDRVMGDSKLKSMRADWITPQDRLVEVMEHIINAAEKVSEWVGGPDGLGTREGGKDHAVLQQLDKDMRALLDGAAEVEARQTALEQIRARLNQGEIILDVHDRYKAHVSEALGKYLSKTSRQRYAQEKHYTELREKIWSARYAEAMPPILDFIPAEDGDEEDEEDIVVGGRTYDYRCPLTATIMEDPVRSRTAILEYLGNGAKECPASGCRERLVASKLREDPKLARDVKTYARRQRERERERMRTQQTGALSIDDDDDDDDE